MSEKQTVNVHGKAYETVASRVNRFCEDHPEWTIDPQVNIDDDNNRVMVRTEIRDETNRIRAAGHAEEQRGNSTINKTSALENCETSSVGRALAFLGYGGIEIASADELTAALKQQKPSEIPSNRLPDNHLCSTEEVGKLSKMRKEKGLNEKQYSQVNEWLKSKGWTFGKWNNIEKRFSDHYVPLDAVSEIKTYIDMLANTKNSVEDLSEYSEEPF